MKLYSPKIKVLTWVKKNGLQKRQLQAEVAVGTINLTKMITIIIAKRITINITKRITNTFEFLVVQSIHIVGVTYNQVLTRNSWHP